MQIAEATHLSGMNFLQLVHSSLNLYKNSFYDEAYWKERGSDTYLLGLYRIGDFNYSAEYE